jgi:hypothetical protein
VLDLLTAILVLALAAFSLRLLYVLAWSYRLGGERYGRLDDLVAEISRISGLEGPDVGASSFLGRLVSRPKLTNVRFRGRLEGGRDAFITFRSDEPRSQRHLHVQFQVRTDAAPHLRVTEESLLTIVQKALGWKREIEVGEPDFDRRFLLETSEPEAAKRALNADLRRAISRAFDLGARVLVMSLGHVTVTASTRAVEPGDYREMLLALDAAARTLDRKAIPVRVLGGERSAFVDPSGKTRCPYCHGGLTGDESDLVACERCSTVLHAGCWEEHGGCPLLGCTGRTPERAVERA